MKELRRITNKVISTETPLAKKAIANIALAGAIALTGASYGCAKDETPPVIQNYQMPEWVVEGEDANFKVDAYNDKKVETVYL